MKIDKSLLSGSTSLLVLSLLRNGDKYGYEIKTYYSQTWMLPPAHLTLVTYDEIGAVLDTVTWDVEAVGAPNSGGGYTLH